MSLSHLLPANFLRVADITSTNMLLMGIVRQVFGNGRVYKENDQMVEFTLSAEQWAGAGVREATLWVKAAAQGRNGGRSGGRRGARRRMRGVTLWAFAASANGSGAGELAGAGGVRAPGWQRLDVTEAARAWVGAGGARLLLDCSGCRGRARLRLRGDAERPFLVVRAEAAAGARRVRRRALDCEAAPRGACCKQSFYVSFRALGWDDWIVAPEGYFANYCRGACGARTPDTFRNYYTHVVEEARRTERLAGLQPCCAPLRFSPMSLIYFGPDANVVKRDLPNMVVDECGCP